MVAALCQHLFSSRFRTLANISTDRVDLRMAYLLQLTRRGYTTSSILTYLFLVLSSILAGRITVDTAILTE
jgi:hypothetical protein